MQYCCALHCTETTCTIRATNIVSVMWWATTMLLSRQWNILYLIFAFFFSSLLYLFNRDHAPWLFSYKTLFTNPVLKATTGCNELITFVVVVDALHTSDCRLAEEKKNVVKEKETLELTWFAHLFFPQKPPLTLIICFVILESLYWALVSQKPKVISWSLRVQVWVGPIRTAPQNTKTTSKR